MTTTPVDSEWVDSDRFLGPKMKRITFECGKCGHRWVRTLKAEPKKDPPCPNRRCVETSQIADLKRENENLRQMLEEGRAPAMIGQNIRVKAVDETARIVMGDGHYTDLRDNIREGESMEPKLPQAQQALADAMFSNKADARTPVISADGRRGMTIPSARLRAVGERAIRGAYAHNSVKPTAIIPASRPAPVAIKNARYNPGRPSAEGYKKG
jgi:hypothetical protein